MTDLTNLAAVLATMFAGSMAKTVRTVTMSYDAFMRFFQWKAVLCRAFLSADGLPVLAAKALARTTVRSMGST